MSWVKPKVNYKRLYESLGRVYEVGVLKGIFYESLQNSLDAQATLLRYDYDHHTRTLTILDNGKGMKKSTVIDKYHGLAETDKDQEGKRKRYGLGASVFPMSCEIVKTLTRMKNEKLIVSLWKKDPAGVKIIEPNEEEIHFSLSHGTKIFLQNINPRYLPEKNILREMKKALKDVVYDYYFLAILNLQKKRNFDLLFNNEKIVIEPIKRYELVTSLGIDGIWEFNEDVRIAGKTYPLYGYVYYLADSSTKKSGIRFTTDTELLILNRKSFHGFNIPADISKRLGGVFQCPYLEDIQLMTRNGFDEQSKKWKDHEDIISRILRPIINEIMDYRKTRLTKEEYKLLQEITKCLEEVLVDIPDFQVFGSITKKGPKLDGLIEDDKGTAILSSPQGTLVSGKNEPHKPVSENPIRNGSKKISKAIGIRKRKRGAPPITFVSEPKKPAVYTAGDGLICINQENKLYKQTQKLSASLHKWYIADLVGTELTSTLPIPDEIMDDVSAIKKHLIEMKKNFTERITKYWF